MDNQHSKSQKLSMPQLLRLGEYGMVLAIIPGTLLSMVTGQFVFAMSPITLSLWLNLFRRASSDRSIHQVLLEQDQEAAHRYESVLESVKRERAEFLVSQAGHIGSRDHPQLMHVLSFRLQCIEKNRVSLERYLDESHRTISAELAGLKTIQLQNRRDLEQALKRWNVDAFSDSTLDAAAVGECLNHVSARVSQLQMLLMPELSAMNQLRDRLGVLEDSLNQALDPSPDIQALWRPLETDMSAHLDRLTQQASNLLGEGASETDQQSFDARQPWEIDRALTAHLKAWGETHLEHGNKLQGLKERLVLLQQQLDKIHQLAVDHAGILEQAITHYPWADLTMLELDQSGDILRLKHQVSELEGYFNKIRDDGQLALILDKITTSMAEKIEQMGMQVETHLLVDDFDSQVNAVLTPLFQRLLDCDDRLNQLSQTVSFSTMNAQLTTLDARFQRLWSDSTSLENLDRSADYRDVYLQLATIRVKLEELNTQVLIGLQQIPYLVENHIRQKFSSSPFFE